MEIDTETLNTIGNVAFYEKNYEKAIKYYTKAIEKNENEAKYYCNRSAACLCIERNTDALEDAQKAVDLNPKWDRCYSREASAFYALRKWSNALVSCQKGLEINKDNKVLQIIMEKSQKQSTQLQEDYMTGQLNVKKVSEKDRQVIQLNNFLKELDYALKPIVSKEERVTTDEDVDVLTPGDIIQRLTGINSEWRNLNPYWVLMLPPTATDEDIKQRYFKMSSKVHPDVCQLENTRYAFEAVKEAAKMLEDRKNKDNCISIIAEARNNVIKERRRLREKGIDVDATSNEDEEIEKETMKLFAEEEQKRRQADQYKIIYKRREIEEANKEIEKSKEMMKMQEEWTKTRDKRVESWRDYKQNKEKKSNSFVSKYIPPPSTTEKRKSQNNSYTAKKI
ncbi:hypothetical protein WA158_001627 [Blastocystis sp. Blastoise]